MRSLLWKVPNLPDLKQKESLTFERDALIRDFEKETRTSLDAEKQIKREEREKEWEKEI